MLSSVGILTFADCLHALNAVGCICGCRFKAHASDICWSTDAQHCMHGFVYGIVWGGLVYLTYASRSFPIASTLALSLSVCSVVGLLGSAHFNI